MKRVMLVDKSDSSEREQFFKTRTRLEDESYA